MDHKQSLPVAAALVALLGGCASLPEQNGRSEVAALIKERGRVASSSRDARSLLEEILNRPLSAADAVHLALVNNPRLQGDYAELGLAAADVYDAGRLSNPRLSASMLFPNVGGESAQVGLGLAQNFTDLLLLSRRSGLAQAEFARVRQVVGAAAINLAADTEAAYFRLVGASQIAVLRAAVANAARVSADLGQRFFDAGNITRLQLTLEQAAASQADLERIEAVANVTAARAELNQLMGLGEKENRWQVAARIPAPLPQEDDLPSLMRSADSSRLDLAAARTKVSILADALGVTRSFRYLGDIEVGIETEREPDGARLTGPTLEIELPLFNQGEGRAARAAAQLQQAEAALRALEIEISNGLHTAWAQVGVAKARSEQYRTSLIPLRESVVARTQEQVNFMLVGQFELLLAKQQEYDAYQGYLEAVRDYWLARTELARVAGTQLASSTQAADDILDATKLTQPKDMGMPGMDHGGAEYAMPSDSVQTMDHSNHERSATSADRKKAARSGESPRTAAPSKAAPLKGRHKKSAAPAEPSPTPPSKKHEGHSDLPTGMESHIPAPADNSSRKHAPADNKNPHKHGDHQ